MDDLRKRARAQYIPVMREKTAQLLADAVRRKNPKTALEIGTSIGTSGIITLLNSDARLTTIEIDPDVQEQARNNFCACGLSGRVEFILGDCHEVVYMMTDNRYDFIILDGPKSHYLDLYVWLIPMLNDNGVLFVDDVAFYGMVDGEKAVSRKHRTNVTGLRKFIEYVKADERVVAEFLTVEDGVAIITKKESKL